MSPFCSFSKSIGIFLPLRSTKPFSASAVGATPPIIAVASRSVMSFRVSCIGPGLAKPPMKYTGRLLISLMMTVTEGTFTVLL